MNLYKIEENQKLIPLEQLDFKDNEAYLVVDAEHHKIYIWVGLNVSQKEKKGIGQIAQNLDEKSHGTEKILIMKQSREFGAFKHFMHYLKKGKIPGKHIERRPELRIIKTLESINSTISFESDNEEDKNMEERIEGWLKQIKEHRKSVVVQEKVKEPEKRETVAEEIREDEIAETETIEEVGKKEEEKKKRVKHEIRERAYFLSLDKYSYNDLCWILAEKIQKMNIAVPSIEDIKKKAEEVFNSSCTYDELCWLNAELDILELKKFLQKEKRKEFEY